MNEVGIRQTINEYDGPHYDLTIDKAIEMLQKPEHVNKIYVCTSDNKKYLVFNTPGLLSVQILSKDNGWWVNLKTGKINSNESLLIIYGSPTLKTIEHFFIRDNVVEYLKDSRKSSQKK